MTDEQRRARIHYHLYESLEGIEGHAKRIVALEELVQDMYGFILSTDEECGDVTLSDCFEYCKHETTEDGCRINGKCWYERHMRELGIEVQ